MNASRQIGLWMFVAGVLLFTAMPFMSAYRPDVADISGAFDGLWPEWEARVQERLKGVETRNPFVLSKAVISTQEELNAAYRKAEQWDQVIYASPRSIAAELAKSSDQGWVVQRPMLFFVLSYLLAAAGALMYSLPAQWSAGSGSRNNGIYHQSSTNRGWVGWLVFGWLVSFYIALYFFPETAVVWTHTLDFLSKGLSGAAASRWFVYGFLYSLVMTVMAIRMLVKYRDSNYHKVRTTTVLFFQLALAFTLPELLARLNMPRQDFKNIWPLDYSFFFSWRLEDMLDSGTLGLFMLFWGVALIVVAVPVLVYFFGKRWYCSWVCGCGGLAETLGDPYRHLSDKSLSAWKIERWLIHGVLVFAVVMTGLTLYTFFSGTSQVWVVDTYSIQKTYGFLIGSVFAGVIGTGFYPIFGNRVWCRFGCPLAAYLGFVQRFKSRFRITTNGGQCISCGNCSTYCEMGIDVRWYAQRGQNIVRSSCVGCGVCASVCPRGVLKLENGSEEGRINDNPILIGREGVRLSSKVVGKN